MNYKALSIAVLFVLVVSSVNFLYSPQELGRAAAQQTQGFQVINSQWGTSNSPVSAAPGDENIPLTVTLEYVFSSTGESVQGFLEMPSGFSLYNGSSVSFASITETMPTGTTFELTFQDLYLASNLALGTYLMPLNLTWTAAGYSYVLNETVSLTVHLEGRPQLYFTLQTSSLVPAEVNYVPLVVSNNGSGTASNVFVSASSQQTGVLNSISEIDSLDPGSQNTPTLQIYAPVSSAGDVVSIDVSASYKDPYGTNRTTSETLDTYVTAVGEAKIEFTTILQTLTTGETNNVTITILNTGTIGLTQISTTISTQTQSVSVLGTFPNIGSLEAGASSSAVIEIYVGPAGGDSPVSLTLATSFVEADGVSGSSSQTLGFYTSKYESPVSNFSATVIPVRTSLSVGQQSNVSFQVKNLGNSTVYSPSISLSVSSPLVIVANSSFTDPSLTIPPEGSVVYSAILSSSPSSTPGSYSGVLAVSFADQQGDQYNKTFSVGFTLTGTIEIVVQDETVIQSTGNLTVSGTLLNEGTASAYYASVSGYTNSSSSPRGGAIPGVSTYIGEVDPNTPVPFTATVPYTAPTSPSRATVELLISYLNNFGTNSTARVSIPTTLTPLSGLGSSTGTTASTSTGGQRLVQIVFFAIIVLIVVVVAVAAIIVRRRKSQTRGVEGTQEDSKVV